MTGEAAVPLVMANSLKKGFRTPNGWMYGGDNATLPCCQAAPSSAAAVRWAVQPLPHPNPIQSTPALQRRKETETLLCSKRSERGLAVALGCGGRGRVHTVAPPPFRSYRHSPYTVTKVSFC